MKLLIWLYSVSRSILISQDILYGTIWKNYLAANGKDFCCEPEYVTKFYGSDFDRNELSTQLQILSSNLRSEIPYSESVELTDILTFVWKLSQGQRSFFKQVCWLVSLIAVMPATNSSSERSFSTMKRVKTYLRSTMGQSRLNHLMILNTYKELLDNMDLVSVANEFAQANDRRVHLFGRSQ